MSNVSYVVRKRRDGVTDKFFVFRKGEPKYPIAGPFYSRADAVKTRDSFTSSNRAWSNALQKCAGPLKVVI